MKRFVHYGCGFTAPDEWINYDASPTLRFERLPLIGRLYTRNEQRFPDNVKYGDIVKGLPEAADSCDAVYCSHVLEHLAYEDFKMALKNTYKILKPGGIFRCIVPDLRAQVLKYVENYDLLDAPASDLMQATMLGIENRPKGLGSTIKDLFGNSKHLWMWDSKSLAFELKTAGFINIRDCRYADFEELHFAFVEKQDRFYNAVAIECKK
jgi:SAM-dependent methyltransferase